MGDEYEGLCAIRASGEFYFYAFIACLMVFRTIVSIQRDRGEFRLWHHRLRRMCLVLVSRQRRF